MIVFREGQHIVTRACLHDFIDDPEGLRRYLEELNKKHEELDKTYDDVVE